MIGKMGGWRKLLPIITYVPFINVFRVHGTKIICNGAALYKCRFHCAGKNYSIVVSEGAILRNCKFKIKGNNNVIEIGDSVSIKDGEFWIEEDGNRIEVGARSSLCGKIHLACTEGTCIKIGESCLFSSEIVIRTGDSHSVLNLEGHRINHAQDVNIDNHVWVGQRVCITKGTHISSNSVVGTGAVCTKSIEESNVVIAGVPAQIVKRNVTWCNERI